MDELISLKIVDEWDKYRKDGFIKSGGFGSLYVVEDLEDILSGKEAQHRKKFALKQQKIKAVIGPKEDMISINFLRMLREINSYQLKHPHISEVKESFLSPAGTLITVSDLA